MQTPAENAEKTQQAGRAATGSLDGIKVVELATMVAGPLCGQFLADHGATVIKVESPVGDTARDSPPHVAGEGAYFSGLNRNKSSIALDLKQEDGRAVLWRLLEDADVFIKNLLPGTLARWGLDYAALAPRLPRLVHCSITGFGEDGPLGGRPGYDAVLQAYCGLMSINGQPESGTTRLGIAIVDMATGMNAGMGVLLALAARTRTGRGQHVDATLYDTALGLLHPYASNYFGNGLTPGPIGNGHPNLVPYDKFRTKDGEIFIGIAAPAQFRRLMELLGLPELGADPRFASNFARVENRAALCAVLEPLVAREAAVEFSERLMQAGVPAAPVHTVPQAIDAAHTAHRAMTVSMDNGYRGLGVPVKLSDTPGSARTPPPPYARDTDSVLAGLGYSVEEIADMRAREVLPTRRVPG
jgi:crotonobetainyl-CoA:carnitine CoA-transferase CaiB-like acyl-CoA transferase